MADKEPATSAPDQGGKGDEMAILLTTDGKTIYERPQNGRAFTRTELIGLIGCQSVQMLRLPADRIMWLDEEGKLNQALATNEHATSLLKDAGIQEDVVVGNVLITNGVEGGDNEEVWAASRRETKMQYKTVNKLVQAIGDRVCELADMPIDSLRSALPVTTDSRGELIRFAKDRNLTRGEIVQWIIGDEFMLEDDMPIGEND